MPDGTYHNPTSQTSAQGPRAIYSALQLPLLTFLHFINLDLSDGMTLLGDWTVSSVTVLYMYSHPGKPGSMYPQSMGISFWLPPLPYI